MRRSSIIIICEFVYLTFVIPAAHAAGLTLTPSFQEVSVIATESSNPFIATQSQQKDATAFVTYHNQNDSPLTLNLTIAPIIATDLYGRFKFNAPLPQTFNFEENGGSQNIQINPQSLLLNPGETATASVTFSPTTLRPGTNAFLLLAQINTTPSSPPPKVGGGREEVLEDTPSTSLSQSLGSSILVNAYGGSTIDLNLIELEWSAIPLRFSLPDYLTLTLKNQGTMRAIPRGVARTTDVFGRELNRGAINEASTAILPNSQRVIYATLSPVKPTLPIMLVRLNVSGYDSDHQSQFSLSKTYLYLNPWLLPGIAITLLLFRSIKKKISIS